jgi:hypothetical protein
MLMKRSLLLCQSLLSLGIGLSCVPTGQDADAPKGVLVEAEAKPAAAT